MVIFQVLRQTWRFGRWYLIKVEHLRRWRAPSSWRATPRASITSVSQRDPAEWPASPRTRPGNYGIQMVGCVFIETAKIIVIYIFFVWTCNLYRKFLRINGKWPTVLFFGFDGNKWTCAHWTNVCPYLLGYLGSRPICTEILHVVIQYSVSGDIGDGFYFVTSDQMEAVDQRGDCKYNTSWTMFQLSIRRDRNRTYCKQGSVPAAVTASYPYLPTPGRLPW